MYVYIVSLVLEQTKESSHRLLHRSVQQNSCPIGIGGDQELEDAQDDSRVAFAPPSPIASAFIEDVSTSSSSVIESSSPPMYPIKSQRQMSVETDDLASECSSVDIVNIQNGDALPRTSLVDLSEIRDTGFRLIKSATFDHGDMSIGETESENVSTDSQRQKSRHPAKNSQSVQTEDAYFGAFLEPQNPEINPRPGPQQLSIEEVFDLGKHPDVVSGIVVVPISLFDVFF